MFVKNDILKGMLSLIRQKHVFDQYLQFDTFPNTQNLMGMSIYSKVGERQWVREERARGSEGGEGIFT